jgi:spore germination protein Q
MNYYQQPYVYGGMPQPLSQQFVYPQAIPQAVPGIMYPEQPQPMLPPTQTQIPFTEQSYIENIFRLNVGKVATVYMNFENAQWGSKIFKGTVLAAGKDHIILKDLNSELRYVLLTIYLNYFTFDEEIDYEYPYRGKKIKK